jgi:hypothetical protein
MQLKLPNVAAHDRMWTGENVVRQDVTDAVCWKRLMRLKSCALFCIILGPGS